MAMQKGEMAINVTEVAKINARNIKVALADYIRHVEQKGVIPDISDAFINRVAYDSAVSKTALRNLFSKHAYWDEANQRFIINGTTTHEPDWDKVCEIFSTLTTNWRMANLHNEELRHDVHFVKCAIFATPVEAHAERAINVLKRVAPKTYRKYKSGLQNKNGVKMTRILRSFFAELGIEEKESGEYQRLFAEIADEMTSRKLDFKLVFSLNPADFLTMSNPQPYDGCNEYPLHSCHAMNRTDFTYNIGNAGYARDEVTFVVFVVAHPEKPESWNNDKIWRQLFFYVPFSSVLLQSRLYGVKGGVWGEHPQAALFRDLVQREISQLEELPNSWYTETYCNNHWGFNIPAGAGFQGYPDWIKFEGKEIKISVRKSGYSYKPFHIGERGICIECGEELFNSESHRCTDCDGDSGHEFCEECGCILDEDNIYLVYNSNGDWVAVCYDCRSNYYCYCEHDDEYHHNSDCTQLANGDWVTDSYLEDNCFRCDCCGEWHYNEQANLAYYYGSECDICDDCLGEYYRYCDDCNEWRWHKEFDDDSDFLP